MVPGLVESQSDKKRLEQSLLISMLIWVLLMGALAIIPIKPYGVPDNSMNPVYIDLVPPATAVPVQQPAVEPSPTAGSPQPQPATAAAGEPPTPAQTAVSEMTRAPASTALSGTKTAASSASRVGGGSTGRTNPAPRASNPYQGQGGEDPFAPLSEADLAADSPEAPSLPIATAQSLGPTGTKGSATATTAQSDALSRRVESTTQALSAGNEERNRTGGAQSGNTASGTVTTSGTPTGTALTGGGVAGMLQGTMDFGDGPGRRLISAPQPVIPAKLLEGQPAHLETIVRFRIDQGGTVILLSIQFDPPLPLDLADYLKNYVFSRWVFSSANSDGQVRFKYSIKVQ